MRLRRSVTATLAAGAAALVALAGPASAELSPYAPQWHGTFGDCSVGVGAHFDGTRSWAIGAATLPCSLRHASTTVAIRLWRAAPGGQWQYWGYAKTSFTNSFGIGSHEMWSGAVCGGGNAYWQTQFDVSVSGIGSRTFYSPVGTFAPKPC